MSKKLANAYGLLARIAARQHGVVTTPQLRAAGVGDSAIAYRVNVGRLHRIHRGVYAVGHARLSFEGRCLAAVLASGDGAVLSHRSAAALWRMLPSPSGRIEVTVPGDGGRARRRDLSLHRSLTLTEAVTTRRSGVPVTRPTRTLVDLRRVAPQALYQRALRQALDLRLISEDELGPDPDLSRSELERMFLGLCRRHRLPRPEVNARVGSYEVDFLWRDRSVIVETDGFRHHGRRAAFESDRARDAELQSRGYRVLRFTYRHVRHSPEVVVALLRSVIGQTRREAGQPKRG